MSKRKPSNPVDAVCWRHDKAYGKIGTSAYWKYNKADEKFIDEMNEVGGFAATAYALPFKAKREVSSLFYSPKMPKRRIRRLTHIDDEVEDMEVDPYGNVRASLRAGAGPRVAAKRKKSRGRGSALRIPRPMVSWSNKDGTRVITTLKLYTPIEVDAAGALPRLQNYLEINSPFQANKQLGAPLCAPSGSTNLQPLGWDQFTNRFNRYVVLKAKSTMSLCTRDNTTSTDANHIFYMFDSPDEAVITGDSSHNINGILGRRGARFKHISNHTNKPTVISNTYTPKGTLGVPASHPDVSAAVTAAPSRLARMNFGILHCGDPAKTNVIEVSGFIMTVFKVMFFDPTPPTVSSV